MLTVVSVGVLSSIAAELVIKLNQLFTGTVLQGKGAFILAMLTALVGAVVKVFYFDSFAFSWGALGVAFTQVWTVAQVFFVLIVETLGLDVQGSKVVG